jgi:hypothetical protein
MFNFVDKSSKSSRISQNEIYIIFQIKPIIGLLEECGGAFYTTMARKGPIMAFLQKHLPKPPFWNIKPIMFVPQKSILQVEMRLDSFLNVLLHFLGKLIAEAP